MPYTIPPCSCKSPGNMKISCTWTDAWYIVCPVQFLYNSWYRKFYFWPSENCLMNFIRSQMYLLIKKAVNTNHFKEYSVSKLVLMIYISKFEKNHHNVKMWVPTPCYRNRAIQKSQSTPFTKTMPILQHWTRR